MMFYEIIVALGEGLLGSIGVGAGFHLGLVADLGAAGGFVGLADGSVDESVQICA